MMNPSDFHILIVDDDERLRELLYKYLKENQFQASKADSALTARHLLKNIYFDLIILDVMMPEESGIELTASLNRGGSKTPILLLTAQGEVKDRVIGLEAGADDYLTKPFEPKELLLRIQSILRRTHQPAPSSNKEVTIGPFYFNLQKGQLRKGQRLIPLTHTETELIKILSSNMGIYLSREELASQIGFMGNPRAIDVQITRLRKKLEDSPKNPKFLQTVRNKGYILWAH